MSSDDGRSVTPDQRSLDHNISSKNMTVTGKISGTDMCAKNCHRNGVYVNIFVNKKHIIWQSGR